MEPPQTNHTHHLQQQQQQQQQWKSLHSHQPDDNASLTASKFRRLESPRDHGPGPSGMAASPVRLGLGLGLESGKCAFTFLQLQELEHQALIFKYMMASIPVPLHLVLPIWKSVVSSPMGIIQPSTGGGLCFDFRNSMEPEPGRCRRTDGKKWRCSKEVVPDHKYCEKHMNRGRNRSRKPVERHTVLHQPPKSTAATDGTDSSTQLSISIPDGLSLTNNQNKNGTTNTIASSPRIEFSPTSVLHKVYYGCSISESSSGSNSKTESVLT